MAELPKDIRDELKRRLWKAADDLGWLSLSDVSKSDHYDNWAKDPQIGGKLERFLGQREVRHYIKDGLLKIYCRERRGAELEPICRLAGVKGAISPVERFERPHGCVLEDGRVVCWGAAAQWKIVVMAIHERCFGDDDRKLFAVVFTQAAAHFGDRAPRLVAEDAAHKLGVTHIKWRDT